MTVQKIADLRHQKWPDACPKATDVGLGAREKRPKLRK
jgi:hypothetical protein